MKSRFADVHGRNITCGRARNGAAVCLECSPSDVSGGGHEEQLTAVPTPSRVVTAAAGDAHTPAIGERHDVHLSSTGRYAFQHILSEARAS